MKLLRYIEDKIYGYLLRKLNQKKHELIRLQWEKADLERIYAKMQRDLSPVNTTQEKEI